MAEQQFPLRETGEVASHILVEEAICWCGQLGRSAASDDQRGGVAGHPPVDGAHELLRRDEDDAQRPPALGDIQNLLQDGRVALPRRGILVQFIHKDDDLFGQFVLLGALFGVKRVHRAQDVAKDQRLLLIFQPGDVHHIGMPTLKFTDLLR